MNYKTNQPIGTELLKGYLSRDKSCWIRGLAEGTGMSETEAEGMIDDVNSQATETAEPEGAELSKQTIPKATLAKVLHANLDEQQVQRFNALLKKQQAQKVDATSEKQASLSRC